ncbi:MAG TPA: hypothetical protein H9665_01070 [Firmicutes bacterium]|nr:hypothetical protein [Bacillota bacterium]
MKTLLQDMSGEFPQIIRHLACLAVQTLTPHHLFIYRYRLYHLRSNKKRLGIQNVFSTYTADTGQMRPINIIAAAKEFG